MQNRQLDMATTPSTAQQQDRGVVEGLRMVSAALAQYGGGVDQDGFIVKGKRLSVIVTKFLGGEIKWLIATICLWWWI